MIAETVFKKVVGSTALTPLAQKKLIKEIKGAIKQDSKLYKLVNK
jgi:hypothetical protein